MPVDMFLKVDGVDGESVDSGHKGEMDILAWSWGAQQSGTMHTGGGGGSGKVSMQDLSVTKYVDLATPVLWLHCASGKHIPKAMLTVRKAGENPLEYLVINMEDVLISSVSTGGSGGEDRLTENVSFNFAKVKFEYTSQKKDGTKDKTKPFGWDIEANVKL